MSDETYYSVLEISEAATPAEIKAAYHRLIREVHPDRLANAPAYWQKQAELKAQEINEAFSVLSKPAKRRTYDEQLDSYRKSQTANIRTPTAQSSTPPQASTSQQHSQSPPQGNNSGFNYQSASASTHAPNSTSKSASQPVSPPIGVGQRLIVALLLASFGYGAARGFWESTTGDELFLFPLAVLLFGGVVYLYRRRIRPLWIRLRLIRPKQQVWATLGVIALALLGGNIAYMKPENILPDVVFLLVLVLVGLTFFYRDQIRLLYVRTGLSRLKYQITVGLIGAFAILIGTAAHSKLNAPAPTVKEATTAKHADPAGSVPTATEDNNSFNYPSYVSIVQRVVGYAWNTAEVDPRTPYGSQAKVTFSISRDGTPSDVRIEHSSGYPSLDMSGLRAVRRIQNFGPLPRGYPKSSLAVEYTFTYNLGQQAKNSLIPKKFPVSQITTLDNGKSTTVSEHPQSALSQPSIPVISPTSKSHGHSLISVPDQASIQAACTFAYSQGPASYHRCEAEQVAELAKNPIAPYLGRLDSSDRDSIQAACTFAYSQGPVSYHQCEAEQVAELAKNPIAPYLGGLNSSDRESIQAACTFAYSRGPASYHHCEAEQLAELAKYPSSPNLGGLSESDRGSIQTACTFAYSQGPATYHRCLSSQLRALGKQ